MRVIDIHIQLKAPSDSMFTIDELREMIEANLSEWDFDSRQVIEIKEKEVE